LHNISKFYHELWIAMKHYLIYSQQMSCFNCSHDSE